MSDWYELHTKSGPEWHRMLGPERKGGHEYGRTVCGKPDMILADKLPAPQNEPGPGAVCADCRDAP